MKIKRKITTTTSYEYEDKEYWDFIISQAYKIAPKFMTMAKKELGVDDIKVALAVYCKDIDTAKKYIFLTKSGIELPDDLSKNEIAFAQTKINDSNLSLKREYRLLILEEKHLRIGKIIKNELEKLGFNVKIETYL